jgi:hypothetical protein
LPSGTCVARSGSASRTYLLSPKGFPMTDTLFAIHEGLGSSRRFPWSLPADSRTRAVEMGLLVLLGCATAAVTVFGKLPLRLPGHNIIGVILPMAFGLSLVPRRGAASVMGASGMATATVLSLAGWSGLGAGAITGLALIGLFLDLALWGARDGWSIYLRLTLAGLGANLAAFVARGGFKLLGLAEGGKEPWELWWPRAAISYPVCGLVAGLISAAVWFRATRRQGGDGPP